MKISVKNQVVFALVTRLAIFGAASYLIVTGAGALFGTPAAYVAGGLMLLLALRK